MQAARGACAAAVCGSAACALLAGCSSDPVPIPSDARAVDLSAFVAPPAKSPEVVRAPGAEFKPPDLEHTSETITLPNGETITRTNETETAVDPATQKRETKVVDHTSTQNVRVGQRWPIESLVGQINGRPIYADEFFLTMEDRILRVLVPMRDQAAAKIQLRQYVHESFSRLVDSELIIAEAQSRLSPEMQQGVLAWLRDMQERTVAQHGGSYSEAEKELKESTGMGIQDYIDQRKNYELAADLLRRKVQARVIVSWKDIERLYDMNRALFAPEPVFKLGRIVLAKDVQAEQIELAKKMFAEGKTFAEVAAAVKAPKGGEWTDVKVGPDGMDISFLREDLAALVKPLRKGQVTAAVDQRTTVLWMAVMDEVTPTAVSLFEPQIQLGLRNQLLEQRNVEERGRYIATLRSRWLSEDIQRMELRLLTIALDRYFDPIRR